MGAYFLDELMIEGIDVVSLTDIRIENKPGCHASMYLKAEIPEQDADKLLFEMESHHPIALYGRGKALFKGVLDEIKFERKNKVCYAGLTVKSRSCLMDIERKSRSFQNTGSTYENLISSILSEYPDGAYFLSFTDKPVGKLIVQYEETDWEFLKRILSELCVPVANAVNLDGIRLYFGVPAGDSEENLNAIQICKNESEYKKGLFLGIHASETDFTDFKLKADVYLDMFCTVSWNQANLVVYELFCELRKGILECEYTARSRPGIFYAPLYPVSLVGVSLEGKIVEVKGNQVRVHLKIDDKYESGDEYWFPYATLSASQDGSGWYYMPETGDAIRVQFPTKYAQEAIVISSVGGYGTPKQGKDHMADPSTKFLSNKSGQKMALTKNGICVTTRSGAAQVSVTNAGTISVIAGKNISITAKEKITLKSKEIKLHASEKLDFISKEDSAVQLKDDGNLELKGAEVFLN